MCCCIRCCKHAIVYLAGLICGVCLSWFILSKSTFWREHGSKKPTNPTVAPTPTNFSVTPYPPTPFEEPDLSDFPHGLESLKSNEIHSEEEDYHKDEDLFAKKLSASVKILCMVFVRDQNHFKTYHVNATWGKRCTNLVFLSSQEGPKGTLPIVILKGTEHRSSFLRKVQESLRYVIKNYLGTFDWIIQTDDSAYIIMENLRYLLSAYKPSEPLFFGRFFETGNETIHEYMSGNAGYVFSKEAARKFLEEGVDVEEICKINGDQPEDFEVGACFRHLGVQIVDTRDVLDRGRFFPFVPFWHRSIYSNLAKGELLTKYNYTRRGEGFQRYSDLAIAFNRVSPYEMYSFEYFLYHLHPCGITHNVNAELNKSPSVTFSSYSHSLSLQNENQTVDYNIATDDRNTEINEL